MTTNFRKKRFTARFIFWLWLGLSFSSFASASLITDHLVENLSCRDLNKETVLRSLRTDFASQAKHIPVKNWGFSAGVYKIAGCWSLSRSQRLVYYLSGFPVNESSEQSMRKSLDMIRRWTPHWARGGYLTYRDTHSMNIMPDFSSLFGELQRGYSQPVGKVDVERNFKEDIEIYQIHRFHQFRKNKDYLKGKRERPPAENKKSYVTLMENLKTRRLTLVNIRPGLTSQHVVLVKSFVKVSEHQTKFTVYDSNYPDKENTFFYDDRTAHFYAPEIIKGFGVPSPESAVGLFIVDEEEREQALEFLVQHYKQQCEGVLVTQHGR